MKHEQNLIFVSVHLPKNSQQFHRVSSWWENFKKKRCMQYFLVGLAEFIGTAILMFLGCLGITAGLWPIPNPQMGALNFGLAVLVALQAVAHISGAHINPQVTLAALILGKIELAKSIIYLITQIAGSTVGFGLLLLVVPKQYTEHGEVYDSEKNETVTKPGVCSCTIHEDLSPVMAMLIEALTTGILVFAVCAVWDKRHETHHDSSPVRVGLVVACIVIATGPLTSAGLNSARAIGPSIWNKYWKHHWVWWVGPTLGSVFVALPYRYLYEVRQPIPVEATSIDQVKVSPTTS